MLYWYSISVLQGDVSHTVTVQTLPAVSGVLEGEERFQLRLIYADNNAVILPSQDVATIIISADQAVSGTVSVLSTIVYTGQSMNGSFINGQVSLLRTGGIYGSIDASWQLQSSTSLSSTFVQSSGQVTFGDMESIAVINLQVCFEIVSSFQSEDVLLLLYFSFKQF